MRICYVGNFGPQHSTESHLAATLEDMGHEVTRIQESASKQFNIVRAFRHDLFLWTRTWPGFITTAHLAALRQLNIPSVSFHLDLYVGISRQNKIGSDPFWRTDYVFTADGDPHSTEVFKQKGVNHHWLKPGVYKKECKKGLPRAEFAHDVIFVGSRDYHAEWPYRVKLLDWLSNTYGSRFKHYGHTESIRNQELNDLYASAKVVVGDSLCVGFKHKNYWSDRIYETTGRGGFMIHPFIAGLDAEFEPIKEVVFYEYNDWDVLKKLIDFYIENDDVRQAIRDQGMLRTKYEHSYHNRMEEMLQVIYG